MADISLSITLAHGKEPRIGWTPKQLTLTQTGTGVYSNTLSIGTSEEDVSFVDVTPGIVILTNLDPTNFVEWGKKDGASAMQAIGRLLPTDSDGNPDLPAIFYFNTGVTLRMKADTGACKVQVMAYEV